LKNRLHRILNSSMIKIKALVENMEVKDLNRISLKWTRQSAAAQPEYEFGVQNPRRSWAKATAEAEGAYQAGVQKAISEKRFGKGVKKAGDTKWQKNTLEKGPARWTQGIQLSEDSYQTGFAPYRETLKSLTLPPRGPKGDPANINRVALVAKALHEKKLSLKSS